jgi:ElaA protein
MSNPSTSPRPLRWQWSPFSELTASDLYAALQLRQRVFVVEQACAYLDADGDDPLAHHLLGWDGDRLVAYARVFRPGDKYAEASIGRVVSDPDARGQGHGRALFAEALRCTDALTSGAPIRLGAQAYLERFYAGFGFVRASDEYVEDGIPHVQMTRAGERTP